MCSLFVGNEPDCGHNNNNIKTNFYQRKNCVKVFLNKCILTKSILLLLLISPRSTDILKTCIN